MSANLKPTNTYLAYRFLAIMQSYTLDDFSFKWIARAVINDLRLPNHPYQYRNNDWHTDCIKILNTYRTHYKTK